MGRKRKEIPIPKERFTAGELLKQNPEVSAFVVQTRLCEWLGQELVERIGEQRDERRGGRAAYVYERKRNTAEN